MPVPGGYQDAPDTETPASSATQTELPSPTAELPTSTLEPTSTITAKPTIGFHPSLEPTFAITASPTIELPPSATPLAPIPVRGKYAPDEVLVRFRQHAATNAIHRCLDGAGATVKSEIQQLSVFVVKIPEGSVGLSLARLLACPEVRLAEPDYLVQAADTIPSDPGWNEQYGLVNIRAPQGWDFSTGSPAVMIAIVDTGVDLGHPDLGAKIVRGYDFVNNDSVPQDDNGHGTHVAGIAAAITNNGIGVAGVSWGAHIMPVKVLDANGNGTFAGVAAGITWAADNGAQIINLSLGGTSRSAVLQDAVDYAYGKGVVLVAAAGNSGTDSILYPARYPHVIAVGATDSSNTRAYFSNYGPDLNLVAPGVSIYSTYLGSSYGYLDGTSMSTPFVSGLASILRSIPGIGSPDVIAWDMESTALDLGPAGRDQLYGYGLIQMDAALRKVLPPTPTAGPKATSTPGSFGGIGGVNFPTFPPPSPSLTATLTLTPSVTWTVTASPTGELMLTGTPTPTAELSAQGTAPPEPGLPQRLASKLGNDWPLGCGGSILILLGLWLAWRTGRRGQHHPRGRQHLRIK